MINWIREKLTPPSIHPILAEIDRLGLELSIFTRYGGGYRVTIEQEEDDIAFKVQGEGVTVDTALADAWGKYPWVTIP